MKYQDTAQCFNLRDLPEELGHLTSFEKIDIRECPQVRNIPKSSMLLKSLLHVTRDEEIGFGWKKAKRDIPELNVQIVEECYNLDWLEN